MKSYCTSLCLCLFICFASAQSTIQKSIYFDSNQSEIKEAYRPILSQIIQLENKSAILLQGHTDNVGDLEFNQTLSRKRVEAVALYLKELGIHESLIQADFFGESRPKNNNLDESDKANNRRVDILISIKKELETAPIVDKAPRTIPEPKVKISPKPKPIFVDNTALNKYLSQYNNTQSFLISTTRDTVLKIEEGNLFYFKKGILDTDCKEVKVKIIPYQSKEQMLYGNITTTSNAGVLESYGMFEIKAYCQCRLPKRRTH